MKISIFRGGFATLDSNETIESWDEFCDLVSTPTIGIKNGDYFIRGFCEGARSDANMRSIDMIIIDGDQMETDGSSCCPPQPIHETLKKHNITHVIYTSYSNDIINSRHKWRLCVPCDDLTDQTELRRGVFEIIGTIHRAGFRVRNVVENMTLSQPWFTPRCPESAIDDFYCQWHDGETYKIGKFPAIIVDSAEKSPAHSPNGQFSWPYVFDLFQSGTLHQGIRAAAGWLVRTTDWADSQIIEYVGEIVERMCPDLIKVTRAKKGEIKSLVEFCRKKSGVLLLEDKPKTWRDYAITAEQLRDKVFPPLLWAIDGLIPEGLTILAGDPKAGKSTLCIDICGAIAVGGLCLGSLKCTEGQALYISLEDPEPRLQKRIAQQLEETWSNKFIMFENITPIQIQPIIDQIDEMRDDYPDARIIVIDTMEKVLPPKPQNLQDYTYYYSVLSPLQRWALKHHIALVMITHKNKSTPGNGDDPFASIMGSTGIRGVADTLMMLSRNYEKEKTAPFDCSLPDGRLQVRGRDVEDSTHALEWDSSRMGWSTMYEHQPQETSNLNFLLIIKSLEKKPLTPKEVMENTKLNRSSVRGYLKRMFDNKLIEKTSDGLYALPGHPYSKEESRW